jgi:protein SCO1
VTRRRWLVALAMGLPAILGCAPLSAPTAAVGRDAPLFAQPWRWTDERGAEVTFAAWRGVPLVVAPFFTSCTTRCPLTLEKLRDVDEAFRRKGVLGQFVLVTLDPATDSSERLARFKATRHLPDAWHILRGSLDDTRALGRSLGVRAMYDDGHIDHDVRIAVFDGAGRRVRDFGGWDFDPDQAVVPW